MKKSLFALAALLVVFSSTAWSETRVFQVSATIPPTAFLNTLEEVQNKVSDQLPQTQQMFRDNRMISVISVVVP